MKRSILTTLALAIAAASLSPVAAQTQTMDPDAIAAEIEARMTQTIERLNLTDAQAEDFQVIMQDANEKRAQVIQNANLEESRSFRKMRQLRSDMQQIDKETMAQLSSVLSAEQMSEYEVIRDEQRAAMKERMRNRQGT